MHPFCALVAAVCRTAGAVASVLLFIFVCACFLLRAQQPPAPPIGFFRASAEQELATESKLVSLLSAQQIAAHHQWLTARPHIAGTPGSEEVAKRLAATLRGYGLAVREHDYYVYLSQPVHVRLRWFQRGRARTLAAREPADKRDPQSAHRELTPGFVAYSASGKVRGPVVYVNYGLPADYAVLEAAGVSVRGAVVLARYGRVHRAVKVFAAEQRGAAGLVIYSDPADDGAAKGAAWPAGPWRAPFMLQRGNAKYSWFWHGDPLTPGVGAIREAIRIPPEEAATLPKIPAAVISSGQAEPVLRALRGPPAPTNFQGGLKFSYRTGTNSEDNPVQLELDVAMDAGVRRITNVVARLDGRAEPDRWVLLGTHHDAWTFGGVDPGSSAAAILELARALSELRRSGWQPRRTILLCFWDAEEYGLIGSTEFAEELAEDLREQGVAYINSDMYLAGRLEAGGSPALRDLVREVAAAVQMPGSKESVYSAWRRESFARARRARPALNSAEVEVELEPLGSGADFVPFQDFLGLPTLSLEFGIEGSYGSYHSSFDSRAYFEQFGDPGWRFGPVHAELLGRTVLRLANAEVVPLRFSHAAEKLAEYVQQLEAANRDASGRPRITPLALDEVRKKLTAFSAAASELDAALEQRLADGPSLSPQTARRVSDHLARAEKSFVVADEAPGAAQRWYRHTVYGWNIYALYAGQPLPELHRALVAGDAAAFADERARLEQALVRATAELRAAVALL
jgi:N-acetylated-alpha-linked acidic dipeptidase